MAVGRPGIKPGADLVESPADGAADADRCWQLAGGIHAADRPQAQPQQRGQVAGGEHERPGWVNKRWTTPKGRERGGQPFERTSLYRLLTNVAYIGKVRYKDEVHNGEHPGIVDPGIWQRVQALLERNGRTGGASEPTTTQLVSWLRTFILLHGKRHPRELGLPDASRFLEQVLRTAKQPLPALESARRTSTSLDVHPGRN